jgi:hypothetical protein
MKMENENQKETDKKRGHASFLDGARRRHFAFGSCIGIFHYLRIPVGNCFICVPACLLV